MRGIRAGRCSSGFKHICVFGETVYTENPTAAVTEDLRQECLAEKVKVVERSWPGVTTERPDRSTAVRRQGRSVRTRDLDEEPSGSTAGCRVRVCRVV